MVTELSTSPGAAGSAPGGDQVLGPGVVAAVVVHEPSAVLPEVLEGLAAQDHPDLQVLLLVVGGDPEFLVRVQSLVDSVLPTAHVRPVGPEVTGFAAAVNGILSLVEGTSGYFLIMHDDVALAPNAVGLLVAESIRSKAAVVGPKLLEWDDPRRLQSVGFDGDRYGDLFDRVEPHEVDQEQHDAIRDVFVLSSACLLVRADLFRKLGGFEPTIGRVGEALDFCWRVHLSGARVVVVPDARARHRAQTSMRPSTRRDLIEIERNRVVTAASLTGRGRLMPVLLLMVVVGLASAIWSGLRRRRHLARARLAGVATLFTHGGTIRRRRRAVRSIRRVSDGEIADLQTTGSSRWRLVLRRAVDAQRSPDDVTSDDTSDLQEPRSHRPLLVWSVLVALFFIGGRQIIGDGLQTVGEFLPLGTSRRDLLVSYLSGWWDADLGATAAHPTAHLITAFAGILFFGKFGLLQTLVTIGMIPLGWWGMSRLCSVIHEERARLAGLLAYAAVPLPYAAVASGRHQALIAYAAVPWSLHLLRSFGGIGGPVRSDARRDVVRHLGPEQRLVKVAQLSVIMALVVAFAPAVAVLVLFCAVSWMLASAVAGGSVRAAGLGVAAVSTALAAALVLNLPWTTRLFSGDAWHVIAGVPEREASQLGWWGILRFGVGPSALGGLILVLYIPLLVVPLIARHSRFLWASRAAILVLGGLTLTVLKDSGRLPFSLPDAGVLLVPVACGLALGVALSVMSLSIDVRGGRFGWRQPAALVSLLVIPIGLVPAASVAVSGRWDQPSTSLYRQLTELLEERGDGDHRTLVLGDARLTVGGAHSYRDGMAFSLLRNSRASVLDHWTQRPDDVDRLVRPLIDAVADHTTLRAGRLMAPLGIRYVVVPVIDRVRSTSSSPLPEPDGMIAAFSEQLDLQKVYSPPSMVIFENTQWIPLSAVLGPSAQTSSRAGGETALVAAELSGSTPVLVGTDAAHRPSGDLPEGTVHWGMPFDSGWSLSTSTGRIEAQPSFGSVMSFDLRGAARGELQYATAPTRYVWVVLQVLAWAAVICVPSIVRRRARILRSSSVPTSEIPS